MSNYNSQLQSNNIDLQTVLQTLQTKAAGGSGNDPFELVSPFSYTVDDIDGAQYGFAQNSNGYYESQNKGQDNSYAICRVNLTVTSSCDITFDVINYAEDNWDYAIFGNLDSALKLTDDADSNIKQSFKGESSASVVNVIYSEVTAGNHYIDVKFIKDSSSSKNNDSVQFKLQEQKGSLSQETINKILAADTDLIARNIKIGVDIFGIIGQYVGSGGDPSTEDGIITKTISSYTNDRVTSIGDYTFANCYSLTSANIPFATTIGKYAFYNCYKLTSVEFPFVTSIGASAFYYCSSLTTASFPAVITIGSSAFYYCKKLPSANFPVATTIGNSAFTNCDNLTTVDFPAVTTIGSEAFRYCENLTTISFPAATAIYDEAFRYCRNLTSVDFPAVTSIGSEIFYDCDKLTTANFPVATTIGNSAFYYCENLTTVSFPVATTIANATFAYCSSLTTVNFPAVATIGNTAFAACINLTTASFPAVTSIGASIFKACYNLISLYLTGSSLCALSNSNAFSSTPIGGYSKSTGTYGSIYVPVSLLTSYQTATNWTYFSSRFIGIDENKDIIAFRIGATSCQAEDGMTWEEWVSSEYNTVGVSVSGSYVIIDGCPLMDTLSTDIIRNSATYWVQSG